MARSLTAKQRRVLDVIRAFQVENGYSPSVRQIGDQLELSAASVQAHLVALDRKNYIRRTGEAHGITANYDPESDECLQVRAAQIIGAIAAGSPIEAITDHQGYVPLPETVSPDDPRDYYSLEVRGNSMIEDHILDGDRVLVRRQSTAEDGDVVVAILGDEEATLKRFYRNGRFRYLLKPANSELDPIDTNRLEIRGVVVGVYRDHLK